MNKYNSGFQENRNAKKDALIIRLLAIVFLIGGFQVATQYFAHQFHYQDQLGAHFNQLYAPWSILVWSNQWYDKHPDIFDLAAGYGILFSSVGLILVLIIKMMLSNSSRTNRNRELWMEMIMQEDDHVHPVNAASAKYLHLLIK